MIWSGGKIVDHLSVDVNDRTFEHGLGFFETLRTWEGHPSLLPQHLERLTRSARELGVEIDPSSLPGPSDVSALLAADGRQGDAMLRITASGGEAGHRPSVVWMRSAKLPTWSRPAKASLHWFEGSGALDGYKTLNYWERRNAHRRAAESGWDEAVFVAGDEIREGSRTSIFFVVDDRLITPPLAGRRMIVPGVMRALVLRRAHDAGLRAEESAVSWKNLGDYTESFLTNSVRGIVPLARIANLKFTDLGPRTGRLWVEVRRWLESGGNGG